MIALSPQQDTAIRHVSAWLKDKRGPQVFRLFGFAGTGKTFLARRLAEGTSKGVVFCAFTGKAALVMRRKGCTDAATIHSSIYVPEEDDETDEPRFVLNPDSPVASADLVIVDEVSMVGEDLGRDLLSFGTKVLVLGDPAQLPPVSGEGYFTAHDPDFMLTEIHRQARDNPIIDLATRVREGRRIDLGSYGESKVVASGRIDKAEFLAADQVLVGRNKTRESVNRWFRRQRGCDTELPVVGDRVVCLRNDKSKKILNGELFDAVEPPTGVKKKRKRLRDPDGIDLWVKSEDRPHGSIDVRVRKEFFAGGAEDLTWGQRRGYQEFTYGYALTVHKAQGSQWDSVLLKDESEAFRENRLNWLYTGLTRAAERVTVVLP